MLRLNILIAFALISVSAMSQKTTRQQTTFTVEKQERYSSDVVVNSPDFDGSFQIKSENCNVHITSEFIEQIESLRHETEDQVVELGGTRKLILPAKQTIDAANYEPYEKMVDCDS